MPEGATPKDGPSAGIGMVTSIVSSLTNILLERCCDDRRSYYHWPSITDRGAKRKLIAAHRAGIKEAIIPKENEKDLVTCQKK